ncbi:MAG: lysophospholipid acyltransferase family protein [Breznakibacter sp.]
METLRFYIAIPIYWLFSLLPFHALYFLSDGLYHLVKLVGYRKRVIMDNLRYSFPEKSNAELEEIRNNFYRHFSDILLETLKLRYISRRLMQKRVSFENTEYLEKMYHEGRDVIAVMAHFGNWEYVPAINMYISAQGCDVYRPLKNKNYDRLMLKLRSRFGNHNIPMKETLREILSMKQQSIRYVMGLIADQSPARSEKMAYLPFLNQNTPVLMGPEKIARRTNDVVVFFELSRPQRGHYHIKVVPLFEDARNTANFEITKTYLAHMEKMIRQTPHLWLWSHKRWKYANPRTLATT